MRFCAFCAFYVFTWLCLCAFCAFCASKIFSWQKMKRFEIVLITSLHYYCCHTLKFYYLCLSLLLSMTLILSATKKGNWTKFLFLIQNKCLNGFNISISFQNFRHILFSCSQKSKFSTVKKLFQNQEIFPQSRNISTNQDTFPQSGNFSKIKKVFHSQGTFPHLRNFATVMEILCS